MLSCASAIGDVERLSRELIVALMLASVAFSAGSRIANKIWVDAAFSNEQVEHDGQSYWVTRDTFLDDEIDEI